MHIRKAFRPLLCAGLCAVLPYTQAQAKEPALHLTAASTYYDNRSTALDLVQSYYNAIGTGQLARAFSYTLKGTPEKDANQLAADYNAFRNKFQDIRSIKLRFELGFTSAGVGTEVSAVPVVVEMETNEGSTIVRSSCHYVVRLSPDAQDYAPFDPIRIDASFDEPVEGDFDATALPDCRF